jgi:hypothetical protein
MCSGGTSRDLTKIKEEVLCNFDITYIPSCHHPPLPQGITFDEEGSLEGQVQLGLL